MCRNIRTLHNFDPPASDDEIRAAALQYVRKVAGTTKPSRTNASAFEQAVDEVAATTARLLDELVTSAPGEGSRDRGGEATGGGGQAIRGLSPTRRDAARSPQGFPAPEPAESAPVRA